MAFTIQHAPNALESGHDAYRVLWDGTPVGLCKVVFEQGAVRPGRLEAMTPQQIRRRFRMFERVDRDDT